MGRVPASEFATAPRDCEFTNDLKFMPHDKNNSAVLTGHRVTIECEVLTVHASESDCNLDLRVIGPTGAYTPNVSLNAGLVENVTPYSRGECGGEALYALALAKQLRKDADAVLSAVKWQQSDTELQKVGARERALVRNNLEEAIMWAGMLLKAINEEQPGVAPDPYPQSRDPQSPVVEPTADGVLGAVADADIPAPAEATASSALPAEPSGLNQPM